LGFVARVTRTSPRYPLCAMVVDDRVVAALPSYEIGSELGRGACGVVLAGRHRQLGRLVAIKQLPSAFGTDTAVRARFIAEARVLATLDHPHVVAIYDFVDYEGLCLLVMERLTGGTVWSRFHAGGFTPDVSCAILLAVCAGLHHAHQHGVLHRDVKPENLMFSGEGTLKVTDLGIAKVIGGSSTLATRRGEVLGTPAYIAPEQALGYELTPATDVYAAGTLLYELLSGKLPFPADSDPASVLYRHVHETPPPLLEVAHAVPADLAAVVDRAVSKSPSDRYQSAEEFGVVVADCAAHTWGRGWLARTNVPVSASSPILAAALGEREPHERLNIPPAVQTARTSGEFQEPVAGDFLPVQMLHPELRATGSPGEEIWGRDAPYAPGSPTTGQTSSGAAPLSSPGGAASADAVGADRAEPEPPPAHASDPSAPRLAPFDVSPPVPPSRRERRASHRQHDPAATRTRRRGLLTGLLAIVVVAAIVGGAVALTGGSSHSKRTRAAAPALVGGGLWAGLPDAPTARQQVASTVDQGTLWVLGGLTSGASTAKVEGFDPVIATWTTGPDLPLPLHHAMAVTYRNEVVVLGGWVPTGSTMDAIVSDRVFALRGGAWAELPPMHHARAAGAAAVAGGNIVVAGGQANHQLVAATEVFDGSRWTDVAAIPTPRDHLAGVSDGRYFYAVGGRALSSDKNSGALERYDPAANQWQQLPGLPTPRGGLGAAIVATRLLTAGGESPTGVFGSVEAFDLTTGVWSVLPPMKTPRHGLALLGVRNTVYALDGAVAAGHNNSIPKNEALDLR